MYTHKIDIKEIYVHKNETNFILFLFLLPFPQLFLLNAAPNGE